MNAIETNDLLSIDTLIEDEQDDLIDIITDIKRNGAELNQVTITHLAHRLGYSVNIYEVN